MSGSLGTVASAHEPLERRQDGPTSAPLLQDSIDPRLEDRSHEPFGARGIRGTTSHESGRRLAAQLRYSRVILLHRGIQAQTTRCLKTHDMRSCGDRCQPPQSLWFKFIKRVWLASNSQEVHRHFFAV